MPQATTRARRRVGTAEADRILSALSAIAQSATQARLHEQLLADAGVRVDRAGASLLAKLRHAGGAPLRVTTLAERLGVDTPTVTRKVQQLERLGLVVREADPDDRRAFRISLTEAGNETLDRLTAAKRRWLDRLLTGWSPDEVGEFSAHMEHFAESLRTVLGGGRGD